MCSEPACNIAKVCGIMTNSSLGDEVARLVLLRHSQGLEGLSDRGQLLGQRGGKGKWRHTLGAPLRSDLPDFWFYQTCKEFGFYQTCEDDGCMFVRDLANASYMASGCRSVD